MTEKVHEERPVEVLAHLVENKPVAYGAPPDEVFHEFTIRAGIEIKTQLEKKEKETKVAAEEPDPLQKSQEPHQGQEQVPPPQEEVDLVIRSVILSICCFISGLDLQRLHE